MTSPTTYRGRTIAFATMHHKESFASEPFRRILQAELHAPPGLDTDQYGTFAGDVPRTLTPRAAARVKARLGMHTTGSALGLASEGSFTGYFGPVIHNTELLLFLDDTLGIEIVEHSTTASPLPPPRAIDTVDEALAYATLLGFPLQGVVLTASGNERLAVRNDFDTLDEVADAARALLTGVDHVKAFPDHRAHRSPSRGEHIRDLATQMATRLTTQCPDCRAPGYGHIETETGLPCRDCGTPTDQIAAEISGCARCPLRRRTVATELGASPECCAECNP